MSSSALFMLPAIVAFLLVAVMLYILGRYGDEYRLTPLTILGLGFILAGLMFGEGREVEYTFMAVGVVLAAVDFVLRWRKR